MKTITDYVNKLGLGQIQAYENLAIAPLLGENSALSYLVLQEALQKGLTITETGSVPQLHFINNTGSEVLFLQGEYIRGGKQNRIIAAHGYLASGFKGNVPVQCVEQSRWTGNAPTGFKGTSKRATPTMLRSSLAGQHEVWNTVYCMAAHLDVDAPTQDFGEIMEQQQDNLGDYVRQFHLPGNAVGLVAITQRNGTILYSADIFDQHGTLAKHFDQLLESYALDAIGQRSKAPGNAPVDADHVRNFLAGIEHAAFHQQKAVSLGDDYKVEGGRIEGLALVYQQTPLIITLTSQPEEHEGSTASSGSGRIHRAFEGRIHRTFGPHIGPMTCIGSPVFIPTVFDPGQNPIRYR